MVIHFYAKLAAQARWLSMSLSGLRALLPPRPWSRPFVPKSRGRTQYIDKIDVVRQVIGAVPPFVWHGALAAFALAGEYTSCLRRK
jgi:hypothetical protein